MCTYPSFLMLGTFRDKEENYGSRERSGAALETVAGECPRDTAVHADDSSSVLPPGGGRCFLRGTFSLRLRRLPL